MPRHWKTYALEIGIGLLVVLGGIVVWLIFFRAGTPAPTQQLQNFGTASSVSTSAGINAPPATNQPLGSTVSTQQIFELSAGPVAGATFIELQNPTTTVARYVMADTGHVLDLPVDVPGAVAQPISGTTIPGVDSALWEAGGTGAVLQYLDGQTIKTVYMGLPSAATTTAPVEIRFLPDNIASVATAPNGKNIAYLLQTSGGVVGYVAKADGTAPVQLFTLPLSQMLLSWPSQGTLMATTKAAAGVPGIAFSINAASGAVSQLVYAPGLSTLGNATFSTVVYQSASATTRATYSRNTQTGGNFELTGDPLPEQCAWGSTLLFCTVPAHTAPADYLDLWHQGTASYADNIVSYDLALGRVSPVATPGQQGGEASDIAALGASPDGKYLLYIEKGSRSLWAVRLSQ